LQNPGWFPRLNITQTSAEGYGQIYVGEAGAGAPFGGEIGGLGLEQADLIATFRLRTLKL
jgi:hypothetical protein